MFSLTEWEQLFSDHDGPEICLHSVSTTICGESFPWHSRRFLDRNLAAWATCQNVLQKNGSQSKVTRIRPARKESTDEFSCVQTGSLTLPHNDTAVQMANIRASTGSPAHGVNSRSRKLDVSRHVGEGLSPTRRLHPVPIGASKVRNTANDEA